MLKRGWGYYCAQYEYADTINVFSNGSGGSTTFVQKRGFLYKLGGNVKNWKLRYVVLNPGYFCYYKDASVSLYTRSYPVKTEKVVSCL